MQIAVLAGGIDNLSGIGKVPDWRGVWGKNGWKPAPNGVLHVFY